LDNSFETVQAYSPTGILEEPAVQN